MPNKYVTDEARKQIGKTSEPRTYEVERGAIRRFAEAIEDRNPIFNSERDARQTRFGSMIAPPMYEAPSAFKCAATSGSTKPTGASARWSGM